MLISLLPHNSLIAEYYENHSTYHPGDSGLDLFMPEDVTIKAGETRIISLQIKCAATESGAPTSYLLFPRSSIAKTPLRLSNSIGLIDSGYRGDIKVALDNFNFLLSDGDSIHVPSYPGVVQVIGEVYNPGYVQFRKRRNLNSYIEAAGGYSLYARKKYITIIQPNGDVKVKDSLWSPKVEEGALIIVHKKREELPFDATAFFKDAASLAASLTTIIYIINTQNN